MAAIPTVQLTVNINTAIGFSVIIVSIIIMSGCLIENNHATKEVKMRNTRIIFCTLYIKYHNPNYLLYNYGPLQSNLMCLLDLPLLSHLYPISEASTLSDTAIPQVATVPGPTSLPGAFIV